MTSKPENQNQLKIQVRPEIAEGKYSNTAMIGHTPSDFIADFLFAAPGMPQMTVVSRIIMTPENAKKLLMALGDNIAKYEAQFGQIELHNTNIGPIGNN